MLYYGNMPPKNALIIAKGEILLEGVNIQSIHNQAARFGVHREPGTDGHNVTVVDVVVKPGVDIVQAASHVKKTLGLDQAAIIYYSPPEDKPPDPII